MSKIIEKTVVDKYAPHDTDVDWLDVSGDKPVKKSYINGKWTDIGIYKLMLPKPTKEDEGKIVEVVKGNNIVATHVIVPKQSTSNEELYNCDPTYFVAGNIVRLTYDLRGILKVVDVVVEGVDGSDNAFYINSGPVSIYYWENVFIFYSNTSFVKSVKVEYDEYDYSYKPIKEDFALNIIDCSTEHPDVLSSNIIYDYGTISSQSFELPNVQGIDGLSYMDDKHHNWTVLFSAGTNITNFSTSNTIIWENDEKPNPKIGHYYKINISVNSKGLLFATCTDYYAEDDILTFTALESNSSVKIVKQGNPTARSMQISRNGINWTSYSVNTNIVLLNVGDFVKFKSNGFSSNDGSAYYYFLMTGNISASGDVTSLLNNVGGNYNLSAYCFNHMFKGCAALATAPKLPATTLANSCYYGMFDGCTSLVIAPELPAETLANSCYSEMFKGCTSLTTTPELPATTLVYYCYNKMFYGCTSLVTAPELPAMTLAQNCYDSMFSGCTGLTSAPELPATTLASSCYHSMFYGCNGLTSAPELPATTLASSCYYSMFHGCNGLTQAPELPATTTAKNCYDGMFYNCTGLTSAPSLPATTIEEHCYDEMFRGCTSLTSTPDLPATTLATYCYASMFRDCTGLTSAPVLQATILASSCYYLMFRGCTSITSHDVATLNDSQNVFLLNSACTSFTVHDTTPPTIANNTITGLKSNCAIYVPAESVDTYKAAQYWSDRASYIQAIP